MSPASRRTRYLHPAALDTAISHAASHARALVEGLGLPVVVAARRVARRMALDARDVFDRLAGTRVSPNWRTGDRRRATSRPRQQDVDIEETNRGAA